jgi:hypothetical protein
VYEPYLPGGVRGRGVIGGSRRWPSAGRNLGWADNRHSDIRRAIGALSVAIATIAGGCAGYEPSAPKGVFFPTVPIGDAYPAASLTGVLELHSGCVFVAAPEDRWLLLWPEGYNARFVNGRLEVLDENGDTVAHNGERLQVGGGESRPIEVGGSRAAERWATDLTGMDIPERCGDLYWLVSPF